MPSRSELRAMLRVPLLHQFNSTGSRAQPANGRSVHGLGKPFLTQKAKKAIAHKKTPRTARYHGWGVLKVF